MAGVTAATAGLGRGWRVRHPRMGAGMVIRPVDGGRRCMVRFECWPATPLTVDQRSLVVLDRSVPPRPAPLPGESTPRPEPADRQSIEALRLGVVPARGLRRLTVGREQELHRVHQLLDGRAGMLIVSGGYGSGKTHLLDLTEAEAISRRFVVAKATFDPVEVPPSHPLRLYAALMRRLRYPDGAGTGLEPLYDRIGADPAHLHGPRAHRWLSAGLFAFHRCPGYLGERVLDFVSGQTLDNAGELSRLLAAQGHLGPRMYALPDYRTFGQVMAHMLGGLASWAEDAGYAGLAVLLDEAEYFDRLGSTSREMAQNVLRFLAMASLPPEALSFRPDAVRRGGHAVHRAVSPRYRGDQPVVVVCAFTPNPQLDRALRPILLDPACRLDLAPVPERLLPLLAERIYGMVKEAYPALDPEPAHRRALQRAMEAGFRSGLVHSTRQAARMAVEFWDLYRVEPARALGALQSP